MQFQPIIPVNYLLPIAIVVAALWVYSGITSTRSARPFLRVASPVLRGLAAILFAVLALNPGTWHYLQRFDKQHWVVLSDKSESMAVKDGVNGATRWQTALELAEMVQEKATEEVEVRQVFFGSSCDPQKSFKNMDKEIPDAPSSDIAGAVEHTLMQYASNPLKLAGIIVFSDGIQVPPKEADVAATRALSYNVPVYSLPVGGDIPVRDLALHAQRSHVVAFADQPIVLPVTVSNSNLGRIQPEIKLVSEDGEICGVAKPWLEPGQTEKILFETVAPAKRVYTRYTVSVDPWPGETSTLNNRCEVGLAVIESRIRVLFVEGLPSWDSKFLVQLLRQHSQFELTEVYRLGTRRNYMVLPNGSEKEINSETLPLANMKSLSDYDVIMFGRGIDAFIGPIEVENIKMFVADHGGSAVFCFARPYSTAPDGMSDIEPVNWGTVMDTNLFWHPSEEGVNAGFFGDVLPAATDELWSELPAIRQVYKVLKLAPITSVLAESRATMGGAETALPLIVSRRCGKGVTVVINATGLWQWDFFPRNPRSRQVYRTFWPHLLEWLLSYSDFLPGEDYALQLNRNRVSPDEPVYVRVVRRGSVGQMPNLRLRVWRDHRVIAEKSIHSNPTEGAHAGASFSLSDPGVYRIELCTSGGGKTALALTSLEVTPPVTENMRLSANPAFLRLLAEKSGGKLVSRDELATTVSEPGETRSMRDQDLRTWKPRWDSGAVLIAIMAVLAADYTLRRRDSLL